MVLLWGSSYRSGHWDYTLNRYVYDDEVKKEEKKTATPQKSLSSPSAEDLRKIYGTGATKKEEPKKEAAKIPPQMDTDWEGLQSEEDAAWENYQC